MLRCRTDGNQKRNPEEGRQHGADFRHHRNPGYLSPDTLVTELAESGAGDQTIMDIARHVSRQMLARYSHIRMEAKRKALEAIVKQPAPAPKDSQPTQNEDSAAPESKRLIQ